MTHQPYDEWLFAAPQDLLPEQAAQLHHHMAGCAECRAWADMFGQAEALLRRQPMLAPAHGFRLRFQERLEVDRQRRHQRQVWLALMLSMMGLLALLLAMSWLTWYYHASADRSFLGWVSQAAHTANWVRALGDFLMVMLRAAFKVMPMALWFLALRLVVEVGLLWVFSLGILASPRRIRVDEANN